MHPVIRTSRRRLLQSGAAGLALAPFFTPRLLSAAPSGRVRHASFGAAGMAFADVTSIAKHPAVDVVAVAEVDTHRLGEFRKQFPKARVYADYRDLLEKEKDLDTVNVSTPDHMHAPMAMAALERGIHVYGQKPLTHNLHESRRLTEVAAGQGLVTQMGIQVHSAAEYRLAVRLLRDGTIGKVRAMHTWSSKEWGDNGAMPDRKDPVPEGLDWDRWIGVAPARPFIGGGWYHPGNWRKRLDFGTGTFGDMGCHIFDPVYEGVGLTAPVSVRSEGAAPNSHSWATNAVIRYVFPATPYSIPERFPVNWYDGSQRPPADVQALLEGDALPDQGSIVIGTDGVLVVPHVARPRLYPKAKFADFKMPEVEAANHWHQFIDAVQGKGKTSAGFDYSGPLTEAILLGSVATRFPNTTLEWNADELRFGNESEAQKYVRRSYRRGWEMPSL